MTTVTDSADQNAHAGLTETEMHGDLTFEINTSRLRRHGHIAAAIAFGLLMLAVWNAVGINRQVPINFSDVVPAIGCLLLAAWASLVRRWMLKRLSQASQTAPVTFHATIMRMGDPSRDIPYTSIDFIKPKLADTADEFMARLAYPSNAMIVNAPLALFQLKLHNHPMPYVLDLDILDGDAKKIPAILNFRIQHAKL